MGVACPQPSSIRCDRVGLAVWLPKRAGRLEASIAGRALTLRWRASVDAAAYGITKYGRVDYYEGFLQPAGLIDGPLRVRPERGRYHWTGRHPVSARVRLVAHYAEGRSAHRTLSVGLAAGWG
ncbi:MAG: hypothetical protein QOD71_3327 [Thermoleophilaceae bacterium]|jgi:hypothetical protein|nr:hypothetical protein [Thermoleophilaceae bacterium]